MSIEAITLAKRVEGLIPRDRFVLFVLADYANDDLEAWPRQATIASDTGYNRTTVNRALKSLEDEGLLTSLQEQRGDGGNSTKRYRLNLHPPRSDKIGFVGAPGVAAVNSPLLQRSTPPVASVNSPLLHSSTPPVAAVNRGLLHSSTASNKEELPRRNYQKNLPPPTPPTAPKPSERGRGVKIQKTLIHPKSQPQAEAQARHERPRTHRTWRSSPASQRPTLETDAGSGPARTRYSRIQRIRS